MRTCVTELDKLDAQNKVAEQVKPILQSYGLGSDIVGSVAGMMVGGIADSILPEDAPPVFTVLGAALGVRRVRSAVKNRFGKFAKKTDSIVNPALQSAEQMDEALSKDYRYYQLSGVDITNPKDVNDVKESLKIAGNIGRRTGTYIKSFVDNYATSTFTILKQLGIKQADELRKILVNIEPAIKELEGRISVGMARTMYKGSEISYNDLFEKRVFGEIFLERSGMNVTLDDAQRLAEDAIARILHSGGKLVDGRLEYNREIGYAADVLYKSDPKVLEMDTALLKDPVVAKYVTTARTQSNQLIDEVTTYSTKVINDELARLQAVNPDQAALFREMMDRNMTPREFKKMLRGQGDTEYMDYVKNRRQVEGGEFETFERYRARKKKKVVANVEAMRVRSLEKSFMLEDMMGNKDKKTPYTDLFATYAIKKKMERYRDAYFPQTLSRTKERTLLTRFSANPKLYGYDLSANATEVEIKQAFGEWIGNEILKVNPKFKNTAVGIDTDGNFIQTHKFKSFDEARRILLDENRATMTQQEYEDVVVNLRQYLTETKLDNGTVEFTVQTPKGVNFKPLQKYNSKQFTALYERYFKPTLMPKSNHLDMQREINLPYFLMNTDLRAVNIKYAADVAPKLHFLKNGFVGDIDIESRILREIANEVEKRTGSNDEANKIVGRLVEAINVATRTVDIRKSELEIDRELKWHRGVNVMRSWMAAKFQPAWKWYNLTEWAMVSPLLTSWTDTYNTMKIFATDARTADNWISTLKEIGTVQSHMSKILPDHVRFEAELSTSDSLMTADNFAKKAADLSGKFSLYNVVGNLVGLDTEKGGLWRLIRGGFLDSNEVVTAINASSALHYTTGLAKLGRQLREAMANGEQYIINNGKRLTRRKLEAELERFGVYGNDVDSWLDNFDALENLVKTLDAGKKIEYAELTDPKQKEAFRLFRLVADSAVEMQHGTNPMFRPTFFTKPVGRILSQYSIFNYNLAFQNVQRQIRLPLQEWDATFGNNKSFTPFALYMDMKMGATDAQLMKKYGLSQEALNELPVEAIEHIGKYLVGVVGIGTISMMTMATVKDLLSYPFVDEKDEWKNLHRMTVINPAAAKNKQRTWGDVYDDFGADDLPSILTFFMGQFASTGAFAKYGDLLNTQYANSGSIIDLIPLGREADDAIKGYFNVKNEIARNNWSDVPLTAGRETTNFLYKQLPIINSSIFSGIRDKIFKDYLAKNKKLLRNTEDNSIFTYDSFNTSYNW